MLTRRALLGRGAAATAGLVLADPLWRGPGGTNVLAAGHGARPRPRGVHLSLADDPARSVTATWFTDGTANPGSVVQARQLGRGPFREVADGTAVPTPGMPSLTHRATIEDLRPGEPVEYRVGRPGAWSAKHTYVPRAEQGPFTLAHVGDVGQTSASLGTTRLLRERRPELFFVAGDLSYANGQQRLWDTWFDMLEPLASQVPIMAAPGNHENKDMGGEAFKVRLTHPGEAQSFWSMDYGNVHVLVSTAGVFLEDGTIAEELAFMEADLAQAQVRRAAGEIDWIVVMQHYPLWTNHESRGPLNPQLVLAEEHTLQRHQVDLLLVGHDHFYERSKRMAYGQPADAGYVQVISGGGGQSLYDFVPPESFQSWSAAHARRFHAVFYEVDGRTIRAEAVASDRPGGETIDRFELEARPLSTIRPVKARSREQIAADLLPLARVKGPRGVCRLQLPLKAPA